MAAPVVLDTGPLVAFIDRRDALHHWTSEQLKDLEPPFLTCEAVLSESVFLLNETDGGVAAVLGLVHDDSDFKLYRRHGRQAIPLIYPKP